MPRSIELLHTRRALQLKHLAQIRNTLPSADRVFVAETFNSCESAGAALDTSGLDDKALERISTLAARYLNEVAP